MYKTCLFVIAVVLIVAEQLPAQSKANILLVDATKNKLPAAITPQKINFLITPNYAAANFGFMCKKEWSIEKRTAIPFRFRVGSLENCNWLEGKQRYQPLQP